MILEDKDFILYGRPLIFMRDTAVPNSLASVWHVIVSIKLLVESKETRREKRFRSTNIYMRGSHARQHAKELKTTKS